MHTPMDIRRKTAPHNPELDLIEVVPFGRYGAGLFTGHPVGLVVVFGLLLTGLFGLPGARWFFGGAVLLGGIWGYFLWLRHK
jgi:hypothetical protein